MSTVTIMMAFAVWIMDASWLASFVVAIIWGIHVLYFLFAIKTER